MSATPRHAARVVLAVALVLALAALLAVRLTAQAGTAGPTPPAREARHAPLAPPPATVPPPAPLPATPSELPCWACPEAQSWRLAFRTDLDLLAPLGTGPANAGLWFADFARNRGARWEEAEAASRRRVADPKLGQVLPGDDPLLREAEPWVDQATMRFYPEILPLNGWQTPIPDMLLPLTLARSWIARGRAAPDSATALADFRRAIRLGRLLRQEDVTLIADLVGIACIRMGAEAIYERAARDGNDRLALVAALVSGEAAPQRLLSAARITEADVRPYGGKSLLGRARLDLPGEKLETLVSRATAGPDRRFRMEAMCTLALVQHLGRAEQRAKAGETLEALGRSEDPLVAAQAHYLLAWAPSEKELEDALPAS
jgi:hypothetical protein